MDGACSTQRRASQSVWLQPAVKPRVVAIGTGVDKVTMGQILILTVQMLHQGTSSRSHAAVLIVFVDLSPWCLNEVHTGVLYSVVELWACSSCGKRFAALQLLARQTVTVVG